MLLNYKALIISDTTEFKTSLPPLLCCATEWEQALVSIWETGLGQICAAHVGLAVRPGPGHGPGLSLLHPAVHAGWDQSSGTATRLLWLFAVLHSGLAGS